MKTGHLRAHEVRRTARYTARHVPIDSALDESIADCVSRGFTAMTVDRFYDGGLCAVVLWHGDESGLEISARQLDDVAHVASDAGVLCVGPALVLRPPDAVPLPSDLHDGVRATSLVRLERGRTIACGIALTGRAGSRIVLVAGAWPYALEFDATFVACDAGPRTD